MSAQTRPDCVINATKGNLNLQVQKTASPVDPPHQKVVPANLHKSNMRRATSYLCVQISCCAPGIPAAPAAHLPAQPIIAGTVQTPEPGRITEMKNKEKTGLVTSQISFSSLMGRSQALAWLCCSLDGPKSLF